MSRRRRLGWFLIVPTAVGCGADGTISDLQDVSLVIGLDGAAVSVALSDPAPDLVTDFDVCPSLGGEVTARVNGISMRLVERGGWHERGGDYERCDPPMFEATLPAAPGTLEVVVRDDTREVSARYGQLQAARVLTLVTPATPTVAVGQQVELSWSAPDDQLAAVPFFLADGGSGGGGANRAALDVAVVGERLTFTIPSVPPGPYRVTPGTESTYRFPYEQCAADECVLILGAPTGLEPPRPTIALQIVAPLRPTPTTPR